MKKLILISLVTGIAFFSCSKKDKVDANYAAKIAGTYDMTSYITQSGNSGDPDAGNNLVVTRIDDKSVKVVIDYVSSTSSDVTLDNMTITKSGSDYVLAQTFSNGSGAGTITGNTFNFKLTYTNGNYVTIIATK